MDDAPGPVTLIVTRPEPQASRWVDALRSHGQAALALPLLHIAAEPQFLPAVRAAWAALPDMALVMFVSPNAVDRFFAAGGAGVRWRPGVLAGATGPGTVAALRAAGVGDADIVAPSPQAERFDAETLWDACLAPRAWAGRRVLIVRGETGRDWLAQTLRTAGAQVDIVSAYRSEPVVWEGAALATLARVAERPRDHAWLFSSSKAIDHLVHRLPADRRGCALATHPRIAATARAAGFAPVIETRPELDAILATLHGPDAAAGGTTVAPAPA